MKDLKKTDIEDIERHWYNYKLFVWFLKLEGKYIFFKKAMFIDKKRTPFDLFETINRTNIGSVVTRYDTPNKVDRMWGSIFIYIPFEGFSWVEKNLDVKSMRSLSRRWVDFLDGHNYDKFKKT